MIKVLFSTPRSGSHYCSELLREQTPGSVVLHEVLSRAAQGIYLRQVNNVEYSSKLYTDNGYYETVENDTIVKVFAQRPESELFFNDLVSAISSSSKVYILHEHVSLIPEAWIAKLVNTSNSVTYLKRRRQEQLASRAIAGHTGLYIVRDNYKLCHGSDVKFDKFDTEKFEYPITDLSTLQLLAKVYSAADALMAKYNVANIVNYEDLPNLEIPQGPKKTFSSGYQRLCIEDQILIDRVLQDCD